MNDSDPVLVDEVVRAAHDAMLASDWERLLLILHPSLQVRYDGQPASPTAGARGPS